jgi:hypothetical protein
MSFAQNVAAEFEAANKIYAAFFNKGDLALPPARYCSRFPVKEQ